MPSPFYRTEFPPKPPRRRERVRTRPYSKRELAELRFDRLPRGF